MKTSELTGAALDWAVAKAEGHDVDDPTWWPDFGGESCYSTDWSEGGPIIERECIELVLDGWGAWNAAIRGGDKDDLAHGPTPLIAAMRCYVASKLGDEVEVPEELQ
jgi:hypothetical protein